MSKTQANDTCHDWLKILRELLPASLLEQVETRASDYELVRELLVQVQLLVDSTEQARERPEDLDEQRQHFSGKKKMLVIVSLGNFPTRLLVMLDVNSFPP